VAKDSHMFYWFFPAQNGDVDAPVTIWLQGGPGGSSLFGLFVENGPYSLTSNLHVSQFIQNHTLGIQNMQCYSLIWNWVQLSSRSKWLQQQRR